MAIYSLPSPPSLWRKLFFKLIIQICQNARIRTIYMADILFVVSASLCLNTSPAETQATKAPSPLLPYHEKLELNSSLASTSSFPKDLVRSPDPTWFPGSLFFSHLLDWEEIARERGGTIRQDISPYGLVNRRTEKKKLCSVINAQDHILTLKCIYTLFVVSQYK